MEFMRVEVPYSIDDLASSNDLSGVKAITVAFSPKIMLRGQIDEMISNGEDLNQPVLGKTLLKRAILNDDLEYVANKILPDEKIDTIAYGCTSGTIAIGENNVKEKILSAKPSCYVTTPVTSAMKAFKQMDIKKIALFTPYPDAVNKTISDYFIKKNIEVSSFASLNLNLDSEFAKVDPDYILKLASRLEFKNADALFISCTALPVLKILDKLEQKIQKIVLSSNQTLIWDTIRSTGYKSSVKGYGKLLEI